jgi:hypothetical protein
MLDSLPKTFRTACMAAVPITPDPPITRKFPMSFSLFKFEVSSIGLF